MAAGSATVIAAASELGLSLVEILIGVTIGVIGILAIFQAVAGSEQALVKRRLGRRRADHRNARAVQHRARREAGRARLQPRAATRSWMPRRQFKAPTGARL